MVALLNASPEPEIQEIAWLDNNATNILATGPEDGTPFTQTSSATGGTATLTTAATTAGSGPNYWNVAANWSTNAVPVTSDTPIIAGPTPDIRYGLAQSAVTLTTLTVDASYTGKIGLPLENPAGYAEYRPTYLNIKITTLNYGYGIGSLGGWAKFDVSNVSCNLNVNQTAQAGEAQGIPPLLFKGTNPANVVNLVSGSLGIAVLPGETANVATFNVGGGSPTYRIGSGVATITSLQHESGTGLCAATVTTLTITDGSLTTTDLAGFTTFNLFGGLVTYQSRGSITTLNLTGSIDFTKDLSSRSITNTNIYKDAKFNDAMGTVTFSNPWKLVACNLEDVTLNLGNNRTYTVT